MARILIPYYKDWFEELSVISSYYESEYEGKFKQHVSEVFPDYYTINYKRIVKAPRRQPRKPDIVMVDKKFSEWWLVEVELEQHDFNHVKKQIDVFLNAEFNNILEARFIKEKIEEEYPKETIDIKHIEEMILNTPPKVMVVVDGYSCEWEKNLKKLGSDLCVFQVYKNHKTIEAYRIAGKYPTLPIVFSHASIDNKEPNQMRVISPDVINLKPDSEIEIHYEDKMVSCKVVLNNTETFLQFIGKSNHIPSSKDYVIFRDSHNRLIIKIN